MAPQSGPGGEQVRSVMTALRVIEEVAAAQPVTLAALARRLDLPKTTLQRSLTTLRDAGWLEQRAGAGWVLTAHVQRMTGRSVSVATLADVASSHLSELQQATGESVLLVEQDGSETVVLSALDSAQILRASTPVGTRLPLHASAGGKAILAAFQAGVVTALLKGELTTYTSHTVVEVDTLLRELAEVAERGWAEQIGEWDAHIASIAAPVLLDDHTPVGAVVAYGPASRLDHKALAEIAPLVVRCGATIAADIRSRSRT